MMIELGLNLLPPQLRQRREEGQRIRRLIALPVVVVLLLAVFFMRLSSQVSAVQQETRSLELQLVPLRPLVARYETVQKTEAELGRQIQTLQGLVKVSVRWSGLVADVSRLIPQDTWINSLSITAGSLSMDGVSLSTGGVARFVASLGTAPMVEKVDLMFVRQDSVGGRNAMRFRIIGRLREESRL